MPRMTAHAKSSWFLLLLCLTLGAAKSSQLMFAPRLPAVVLPPPSTNGYGLHVIWDAVPFAESYNVWFGTNPSNLSVVTNVATTGAVFRVYATNGTPWVGVTTLLAGQESVMSPLLTKTNYIHVFMLGSPDMQSWIPMLETNLVNPALPAQFFKGLAVYSNNWTQLP